MPGTEGNPRKNTNTLARRCVRLFRGAVRYISIFAVIMLALCAVAPTAAQAFCANKQSDLTDYISYYTCENGELWIHKIWTYKNPYCVDKLDTHVTGGTCTGTGSGSGASGGGSGSGTSQAYMAIINATLPLLPEAPPWIGGTSAPPDEGKPQTQADAPEGGGVKQLTPAQRLLRYHQQQLDYQLEQLRKKRGELEQLQQTYEAALQAMADATGIKDMEGANIEKDFLRESTEAAWAALKEYNHQTNDKRESLSKEAQLLYEKTQELLGQRRSNTQEYHEVQRAREEVESELQPMQEKHDELFQEWKTREKAENDFFEYVNDAGAAADRVREKQSQIDEINHNIASIQDAVAALADLLVNPVDSGSQNQTKAGLPVDATIFDRSGRLRWWTEGSLSRIDDRSAGGFTGLQGTVMGGFTMLFDDLLGVSAGAGFSTSNSDTAAGGALTSNGISLAIRGYQGLTEDLWFDATAGYGYHLFSSKLTAVTDKYGVHQFSFGGGFNASQALNEHWSLYGRLGWEGALAQREASTDSLGVTAPSTTANFGEATATGGLTYRLDRCELYGEGALRYVTNDSSGNFTAHPIDGAIGGGMRFKLNERVSLSGNVSYLVGRSDYDQLSATVRLDGRF